MPRYKAVYWFAKIMNRKLCQNIHKTGWDHCSNKWLLTRLKEEVAELEGAFLQQANQHEKSIFKHDIPGECADIANFAMMIADNCQQDVPHD